MFGLFRMEETWTYFPPICDRTLAYSFSAPMALITPVVFAPAVPCTQAAPMAAVPRQARANSDARTRECGRVTVEKEGRFGMRQPYTETQSQYKSQTWISGSLEARRSREP